MSRRCRNLSILTLTIALLMGRVTPSTAAEKAPPLAGTVSMVVNSLALTVGAEWGQGVLTLADGTQHRFTIKGIELGSVGAEKAFLHGHVYHLTKVEDFPGLYGAAEIGFTVIGGQGGMAMRNQQGVTIYLESVEQGSKMTLGISGAEIKLQP